MHTLLYTTADVGQLGWLFTAPTMWRRHFGFSRCFPLGTFPSGAKQYNTGLLLHSPDHLSPHSYLEMAFNLKQPQRVAVGIYVDCSVEGGV